MQLPDEIWLLVLDIFTDEWIRVRTPLYDSQYVFVSGYAKSVKDQLLTLGNVCRSFHNALVPHIFHTIAFRPPYLPPRPLSLSPPSPYIPPHPRLADYRQLCEDLLAGSEHATSVAGAVKQCIFTGWDFSSDEDRRLFFVKCMEDDLRAVKEMKNIESLLLNDGGASWSTISDVLNSLPGVRRLCLGHLPGELDMLEKPFPASNVRELTIYEPSVSILPNISLSNLHTLRIPLVRGQPTAITFFERALSIPSLKSLHLDSHWFVLESRHFQIPVHPQLLLESITCPLELASVLLSRHPLKVAKLRPSDHLIVPQDCLLAVAALESNDSNLLELEIPYQVCQVNKWMSRVPITALKKLHITYKPFHMTDELNILYDQLWLQFEERSLPCLQSFKMFVRFEQLNLPFQRTLIDRLTKCFPSIQLFCFSKYLEWHRDTGKPWRPTLTIEPGEPLSWFRDGGGNGPEYLLSSSKELLVDDVGLFNGIRRR